MTETIERTPTTAGDELAEQAVLAACLNQPTGTANARRTLNPDSFYRADHALIFAAMIAVDDRSALVDPISVYGELLHRKQLGRIESTYLHTLWTFPYFSAGWAIRRVANLAHQRARAAVAQRIGQIGTEVTDPDDMADALAKSLIELEVLIDNVDEDDTVPGLDTWAEFMARPEKASDAVVPGLLDRQETVMVLAAPGVGKSWLSRQVAITVAAGVHPFITDRRIPPMRTLLIDLENPESTVRRQTADPYHRIQRLTDNPLNDNAWVWMHTAGLNIRKRPDAALLERVISETRPDLVCVGSLYNVFSRGSSDWDTAAEETISVFNRLRARYGCAFWIEHHMPRSQDGGHRQSPFGSTLWERWPSYGRVIKRIAGDIYEFSVFRGDREAGREFPPGLRRAPLHSGPLTWLPIWDADDVRLAGEAVR